MLACVGTLALGCSVDTDDLFNDASSASGTGGDAGGGGNGGDGGGVANGSTSTGEAAATSTGTSSSATTSNGSTSSGAVCGNGVAEAGEACDGSDLGGADCTQAGFATAAGASCSASCELVFDGCMPVCGNGQVEPGENCDDGNLLDSDLCSAQCQALGLSCTAPAVVALGNGSITTLGSTVGGVNQAEPGDTDTCSSGTGPERIYAVTAASAGFVTAWLEAAGTSYDAVLYARVGACDGASAVQAMCHDNDAAPSNAGEVVSLRVVAGQTVYFFVDGFDGDAGDYKLNLDLSLGDTCADPVPIVIEGTAPLALLGSTEGFAGNASSSGCFGGGPDVVYSVNVTETDAYTFETQNGAFNSVTYARSVCTDGNTQLDCDNPVGNDSAITIDRDGGTTTFVWVDATQTSMPPAGPYALVVSH
jgi:cysteine-rich repeat protein